MSTFDISKMTSDDIFALLDETSDQEEITDRQAIDSDIGGDSDADDDFPNESTPSSSHASSSRGSTPTLNIASNISTSELNSRSSIQQEIPAKRICQSSTIHSKESDSDSDPYSSDDSLKDPNYTVDNKKRKSYPRTFTSLSESSTDDDMETVEPETVSSSKNDPRDNYTKIKWTKTSPLPNLLFKSFVFDQPFGVQCNICTDNVLSIFESNIDDKLMELFVVQSNLYASQKGVTLDLHIDELKAFFGLLLLFGINNLPSIRLYWSNNHNFYNERVSKVMTMKRFLKILRFLHLADNEQMPKKGQDGYNKLYKVQPLLTHLSTKFKENFAPSRFISIDESMVAFTGRSVLKQYMPLKPIKRGIKVWAMACAETGYMIDFDVYQGKSENPDNLALGEKVVVNLSKSLSGHGYCLYFDNFFSSFPLFQRLLDEKLFACGTFRLNRKHFPHDKLCQNKDLSLGQFDFASSGDITVYKWKDRSTKPVILASNMHDPSDKTIVQRRNKKGEKEDVICPRAIRDYNLHMGGVDRFDQLHSTYNTSWKSRRWWMKLFFYFLDATVVNSYILYKTKYASENHATKCMTHLQFRSCLIDQLIGTFSSKQRRGRPIDEEGTGRKNNNRYSRGTVHNSIRLLNVGSHLPVISTYRRCAFCSTKAKQKRSNLVCKACKVALCKKCFEPFHQNNKK